ncbi:MAG TPA: ankyrin repeat domain-containing protein [Gammaproteobacteria bacterium]|nr:ankyrin repeat domain-containing protein [Gammaproteobacteria bacterium]
MTTIPDEKNIRASYLSKAIDAAINGRNRPFLENFKKISIPRKKEKERLLHYAVQGGNLSICNFLVEDQKTNPLCLDNHGWTLLGTALYYGRIEAIEFLVTKWKLDVNAATPLSLKMEGYIHQTPVVQLFSSRDLDVGKKKTAIFRLMQFGLQFSEENLLYIMGCIGGNVPGYCRCKDRAICNCPDESIDLLLTQIKPSNNILYSAATSGAFRVFKYCIEQLKRNIKDYDNLFLSKEGCTTLQYVTKKNNFRLIHYVQQICYQRKKADYKDFINILIRAAEVGRADIISFFIKHRQEFGYPAVIKDADLNALLGAFLHNCLSSRSISVEPDIAMVEELISFGIKIDEGKSKRHYQNERAKFLLKLGFCPRSDSIKHERLADYLEYGMTISLEDFRRLPDHIKNELTEVTARKNLITSIPSDKEEMFYVGKKFLNNVLEEACPSFMFLCLPAMPLVLIGLILSYTTNEILLLNMLQKNKESIISRLNYSEVSNSPLENIYSSSLEDKFRRSLDTLANSSILLKEQINDFLKQHLKIYIATNMTGSSKESFLAEFPKMKSAVLDVLGDKAIEEVIEDGIKKQFLRNKKIEELRAELSLSAPMAIPEDWCSVYENKKELKRAYIPKAVSYIPPPGYQPVDNPSDKQDEESEPSLSFNLCFRQFWPW